MTLNGIDISGWQAGIDLNAVPADFVIMKATGGVSFVSNDCDRQYQQAKAAGKLRGIYHFANDDSRGSSAIAEADFFVDNTLGYHDGETLLVLDFEAQALPLGAGWAKAWLDRVHARTGIKPILYLMGSAAQEAQYDVIVNADYGLWLAHWVGGSGGQYRVPTPVSSGRWKFYILHQYSESGQLPGYSGPLDLNILHGDRSTWLAYAAKNGKPATPAPTPTPTPNPTPGGTRYTVQPGDALSLIAERHGVSTAALAEANGIANPNVIYAGQVLTIPAGGTSGRTYTVVKGDTLGGIAQRFGTTWQALQVANGIANANRIYPGQVITIP